MAMENKAVLLSLFLCCILMGVASSATRSKRTRREYIGDENYSCSDKGKHDNDHPKGVPKFTNSCGVMEYEVDNDIYFACYVKSNPVAKITWLFNGEASKHKTDHTSCYQKLHIPHAQLDDSGTYTCIASNEFGSVNRTCRLTIVPKRRFSVINKGILLNGDPTSNEVAIGSPLNMTCEVYNAHHVYWTKNRSKYPPSAPLSFPKQRIQYHKEKLGSTMFKLHLIFSRVEEEDRGNYSCVGRNTRIGFSVRTYTYLEPVYTSLPAGRLARSSSSTPGNLYMKFLVLAGALFGLVCLA